ncbi:MAG: AraC family transcriptional regulator [Cytophagales bacterium]
MILQNIIPKIELAPYIDTFWVFEHDFGVPVEDSRIIAPNGKAKFIYTYKNALSTIENGIQTDYPENDIFFIGIWDKPVTLYSKSRTTGTIGIELTASGLHRFTRFSAFEVFNKIYSFKDIYGTIGCNKLEELSNTENVFKKVEILQNFLIEIVRYNNNHISLIDYAVDIIYSSKGLISIKDLESKMGYSKRYIDSLFKDYIGISPKKLASIERFQSFYHLWANADTTDFYTNNLVDNYYDQAHFIKEFKKYTGHSPLQYAKLQNEFGKIFYKNK